MRETAAFISCAFAARREAMAAIGGFDPSIFRQGEERDLAIRLMDAGYEIRHNDDIVADHRESDGERDHQFIHAKALRNELLFVIKRVPAAHAPWRLLRHALGHVRFCMSRQWWRAMAVGFGGFFQDVLPALSQRRAVSIPTWHRFVRLVAAPLDYDAGDPSHSAPWNARPTQ
jgi:GT2 family glycosyltransferase